MNNRKWEHYISGEEGKTFIPSFPGEPWLYCRPIGLECALTWRNIADFCNFLYLNPNVKLVVELGANFCGFSALMAARTMVFPDFAYLGIELESSRKNANFEAFMAKNPRLAVIWGDMFDYHNKDTVKQWINATAGQALVFCDGTNKPKELNEYAPLLRTGDYLMMHDFFPKEMTTPGNPCWEDVAPYITSGQFIIAFPDYWSPDAALYLIKKK